MEQSSLTSPHPPVFLVDALATFVKLLIPGDGEWPAADAVGVQHAVLLRLIEERGNSGMRDLANELEMAGAPFTGKNNSQCIEAVTAFEAKNPSLFKWLRDATYFAYYEAPTVIEQINTSGVPYAIRPHLTGYELPRFDPATQTPQHGRGTWIPTDQVAPVDITHIELDTKINANWGLKR